MTPDPLAIHDDDSLMTHVARSLDELDPVPATQAAYAAAPTLPPETPLIANR